MPNTVQDMKDQYPSWEWEEREPQDPIGRALSPKMINAFYATRESSDGSIQSVTVRGYEGYFMFDYSIDNVMVGYATAEAAFRVIDENKDAYEYQWYSASKKEPDVFRPIKGATDKRYRQRAGGITHKLVSRPILPGQELGPFPETVTREVIMNDRGRH